MEISETVILINLRNSLQVQYGDLMESPKCHYTGVVIQTGNMEPDLTYKQFIAPFNGSYGL